MKECYVFTYGVDGFGADTAPAYEAGIYLDYDKAFSKWMELEKNAAEILEDEGPVYKMGYQDDGYYDGDEFKDYPSSAYVDPENDDYEYTDEWKKKVYIDFSSDEELREELEKWYASGYEPRIGHYMMVEAELYD